MVQKRIHDKIEYGKEKSGVLSSPEAKEIFNEMCGLFDQLVQLTKQCEKEKHGILSK